MILEREANKVFEEIISEEANQRGFKFIKNRGTKTDPPYLKRLKDKDIEKIGNLHLEFFNGKLLMTSAFNKHIHQVESIWFKYFKKIHSVTSNFDLNSLITVGSNASLLSEYKYGESHVPWFRYTDNYEVEASLNGIKMLSSDFIKRLDEYVVPLLDKYDHIKSVDLDMNSTPETYYECLHIFTGNDLIFKKMIVSKLAENPMFSKICDLMYERIIDSEDELVSAKENYLRVWSDLKVELELI